MALTCGGLCAQNSKQTSSGWKPKCLRKPILVRRQHLRSFLFATGSKLKWEPAELELNADATSEPVAAAPPPPAAVFEPSLACS